MTYDPLYHFTTDAELLSDVCQFTGSTWNETLSIIPEKVEVYKDLLDSYKCYEC